MDGRTTSEDGQHLPPTRRFDVLRPKEWRTPIRQAHE